MTLSKNPMRPQMTVQDAVTESGRCLLCEDAPCSKGCPAGTDPGKFIRQLRFANYKGAARTIRNNNVMGYSCAFVCPVERLCEKECSVKLLGSPIDISGLQRFACEWGSHFGLEPPEKCAEPKAKVAIVGSGPAGLSCAARLAILGYAVTIFERDTVFGGMLKQSIPPFRLPDEAVDFDIESLKKFGVEFAEGSLVEDPKRLLADGFGAVFLATGLSAPLGSDFTKSDTPGVYQALKLLKDARRGSVPELGKRVIVIGGGDTALDAARTAKRAGSEVFVLYRRTQNEMPASRNEVDDAWREGVEFYFRVIVRSIVGGDRVKGVRCVRIKWRDKILGIKRSYDIDGTEFTIACDSVIVATGQGPADTFKLRTAPDGTIAVDTTSFMTSENGIFAGGDIANGGPSAGSGHGLTVAKAVGDGKKAADAIDKYIKLISKPCEGRLLF